MRPRPRLLSALIAVPASLALAGCGSNAAAPAAGTTTDRTTTTAAAPTTPAPTTAATYAPPATSAATESNPAGDIPDNQVFVPYQGTSAAGPFTVTVPEGWARSGSGATVTFTDKLNSVRIDVVSAATAPTVDSVTTTDLPALVAQGSNVTNGATSSVTRTAGTAILLTYQADAAADPVTGKVVNDDVERYAFWQSGAEVVLTLSGPHGADNVDPWRTVTDSFGWTP